MPCRSTRSLLLTAILLSPLLSAMPDALADSLTPQAREAGLVDVSARIPGLVLDVRYATTDNFAGEAVYPAPRCWLQEPVAERLARVQGDLEGQGLGLKVFDCYRPFSVQERFWALVPDDRYVGRPVRGEDGSPVEGSRHNRGAAVDVSLVHLASGEALAMPTDYDDFSERAAADHDDGLEPRVIANRDTLIAAMAAHGFQVLPSEWWHFDAEGWEQYPLLDIELR